MKKLFLVAVILLVAGGSLFAAGPKYFAFTIGAGGGYDVNTGAIVASNNMGFAYSFNELFSGGFSFIDIGGQNINVITMSVTPIEMANINIHSGQVAGQFGLGLGFDFQFLQKSDAMFTGLGVYADWFAGNGGAYDIANGGVLTLGLKTQIGL